MLQGLGGWHLLVVMGVLLVPLLIVGVVIAFGVLAGRRIARTDEGDSTAGGSTSVVSVALWLGAIWAGLAAIGAVVSLISTLASPAVTLTVPVREYWPLPLPGVTLDPASAGVVGGGFTSAELTVEGLLTTARMLWGTGTVLGILVPGATAGLSVVHRLPRRVLIVGLPPAVDLRASDRLLADRRGPRVRRPRGGAHLRGATPARDGGAGVMHADAGGRS